MASINFAADGTSSISFNAGDDQFDPTQDGTSRSVLSQAEGESRWWLSSSQDTYERSPRAHEPTEGQRAYSARFDAMSPVARALLLAPELGQYVPVSQHRHLQSHYEWGGTYIAAPGTQEANTSTEQVILPGYPYDGWKCELCDLRIDKIVRALGYPQDVLFGLFGMRPPWVKEKHTPAPSASTHKPEGERIPQYASLRFITVEEASDVRRDNRFKSLVW